MSRAHPHYFPDEVPDPVAEPYGSIDALLRMAVLWIAVGAGCGVLAAVIALFFPTASLPF
ncbi:hypothetical protein [Variovorax paradoxus]|uniref:Uncharacterized protein n=1 Tax=Variovorax paradoxus TaxID=34073 RepID=A0A679J4M1_VARPD|nr:hypothetical protein VVAX_03585 [Variovorax paradoxus]